jgi:hypothetical protein
MSYLAKTDVTITWSDSAAVPASGDILILGRQRKAYCTLAFGDAALQYPTGGIPMPDLGKFGMVRNISGMRILTGEKPGISYQFDATNHKLLAYAHTHSLRVALTSADAAGDRAMASAVDLWVSEPAAGGSDFEIAGLGSGVTSHGGVESSTLVGALDQMADGIAPAATSLYVEVTGW